MLSAAHLRIWQHSCGVFGVVGQLDGGIDPLVGLCQGPYEDHRLARLSPSHDTADHISAWDGNLALNSTSI